MHNHAVDDIAKKSVDSLLLNSVNSFLVEKTKTGSITEVARVIVTLDGLGYFGLEFESILSRLR